MTALSRWLPSVPLLEWGRAYNRETFTNDAVAALIVTIMLIPQSLAYALLAYKPTSGGNPASKAYAKLCGISMMVTISAATASLVKVSRLYWRPQSSKGTEGSQRESELISRPFQVVPSIHGL